MKTRFLAIIALSLALFAATTRAATNSWIDGNGKWETATNWSLGTAPSSSDAADLITNAGNNVVTIDLTTTTNAGGASMTINNVTITSNTLFLANAGVLTPLQIISGAGNTGLRVNSGGSLVISNSFLKIKSQTPFVDGSLLLDGGLLVNTNPPAGNTFYVGLSTPGRLTLSNGTAVVESMRISSGTLTMAAATNLVNERFENFGATWINGGSLVCTGVVGELRSLGQTTVSNGTVLAKFLEVGYPYLQDGSLTVNGGTMLISSSLTIGNDTNVFGHVMVAGGSLYVTNSAHTGLTDVRYGTLTLNTGGVFVTDSLLVTNPYGSFVNNGGTFTITGLAQVDQGTQTVSSGTTQVSSNFVVGSSVNSTGTVNVTGGTLTVTNGVFAVGNDGTLFGTGGVGHVTVSSGLVDAVSILIGDRFGSDSGFTVTSNGHVLVRGGFRSNGIKTTLINGGTFEVVEGPPPPFEDPALHDRIVVSYLGDGRMIVSNGTVRGLEMVIGLASGGGTFEMAGGSVNLSSNLLVGMNSGATGTVFITGGSLIVTSGVFAIGNNGTVGGAGGLGRVAVSNGTVEAASILVGDSTGGDSSFTVVSNGHVMVQGGLRANGIKTTLVNGGTLEVVAGPSLPFEDPLLHNRIVIAYLDDGKLVVSNGTVRTPEMLVGVTGGKTGTLFIAGGIVTVSSNLVVGDASVGATGIVTVTGGTLQVTNATQTATLDVRYGTVTISGGLLQVDRLVMTNAAGRLVHTGGGTISATVLVLDPALSAAGDGLPNGWKQQYGLDPFNPTLGSEDADGDSLSNQQEYNAGTNPNDPHDPFRITSVTRTNNDVRLVWTSYGVHSNVVEAASSVTGTWSAVGAPLSIVPATPFSTNFVDNGGATNVLSRFYRVRLVP